jgi:hypothetical protein
LRLTQERIREIGNRDAIENAEKIEKLAMRRSKAPWFEPEQGNAKGVSDVLGP